MIPGGTIKAMKRVLILVTAMLLILVARSLSVSSNASCTWKNAVSTYTGTLQTSNYLLNYSVIAEPLIKGGSSHLILYYSFTSRSAKNASIELNIQGVNEHRTLRVPTDHGVLVTSIASTMISNKNNTYTLNFSITLIVNFTNGSKKINKAKGSLCVPILSAENKAPMTIIYGSISSLTATIGLPIAALLYTRGKRRGVLLITTSILILLLLGLASIALQYSRRNNCTNKVFIIKYLWFGPKNSSGALYIEGENSSIRFLNISYTNLEISHKDGCPEPFCLSTPGVSGAKIGYYFNGVLRDASIHKLDDGEAIYDECGHLLRLYRKGLLYVINASTGYNPPIRITYYIIFLSIPPLIASTPLIAAILVKKRGIRHRG